MHCLPDLGAIEFWYFDLDDCLFDIDPWRAPQREFVSTVRGHGWAGDSIRLFRAFASIGISDRYPDLPEVLRTAARGFYHLGNHLPVDEIPGAIDTLSSWRCPRGGLSNGVQYTQNIKLKALGIERLFDTMVLSEQYSGFRMLGGQLMPDFVTKPRRPLFEHAYREACRQLGKEISPDRIGFIDDHAENVIGARNFGFTAIYLHHGPPEALDRMEPGIFYTTSIRDIANR